MIVLAWFYDDDDYYYEIDGPFIKRKEDEKCEISGFRGFEYEVLECSGM
jgi:hypothetical protein